MMRRVLIVVGLLLAAMGLLWIGQGLGYVRWPQSSFMIDQRPWVIRGTAMTVVGLVLVLVARRMRR
jgi:uncharacterized membrane protein